MKEIQDQIDAIFKMTKNMLVFRAVVMLILGIFLLIDPLQTLWWMTIIIGAFILIDGIMLLAGAVRSRKKNRGVMLTNSVLLIMLGIFSLAAPLIMDMIWVMLLGIWQLLAGFQYLLLRRTADSILMTAAMGVVSVLAGIFCLLLPFAGAVAAMWVLAVVLLGSSVMSFATALKL